MLSHDRSIRKEAETWKVEWETLGKVEWQTLGEIAWLCYRSKGQIPWEVWICCSSLSRLLKCRSQRWQVWATRRWTSRMWRFMLIRLTVFSHLLHLTFFSSKTVHPATKWIVLQDLKLNNLMQTNLFHFLPYPISLWKSASKIEQNLFLFPIYLTRNQKHP